VAKHIEREKRDTLQYLPFPSTLTDDQRASASATVEAWRVELARQRDSA